ncbi:MAG: serine hydrolase [Anaerotignum sp.]|nr:serine hydrolase [Anaerotignum sp.]
MDFEEISNKTLGESAREKLTCVISSEYTNIMGVVIIKDNRIAYRQAFQGYDMKAPVHVASLTKSILSALVGIAIKQGYIESVKQRVMSFFPDYQFKDYNGNREAVTIENLLNMTVPYSFEAFQEPLEAFSMSADWVKFALEMIDENGKIGAFKYSTEGAHLLSAILTRATGKSTCEFANEVLFEPIGMSVIAPYLLTPSEMNFDTLFGKDLKGWANDPQGITTGGWGITLTPDDMARFGLLYLNHGSWNQKQIVPKEWIAASARANENSYAYLWWQLAFGQLLAFAAMGDGGNVICCIPQKQMVIAIASAFMPNPKDRCNLIGEYILSYFD